VVKISAHPLKATLLPIALSDGVSGVSTIGRCVGTQYNSGHVLKRLTEEYKASPSTTETDAKFIEHYKAFCLLAMSLLCVNLILK
jgi:hypothetical protein